MFFSSKEAALMTLPLPPRITETMSSNSMKLFIVLFFLFNILSLSDGDCVVDFYADTFIPSLIIVFIYG